MRYQIVPAALTGVALVVAAACDGSSSSPSATRTASSGATAATAPQSTPRPAATTGPNENGKDPVFWRSADNFANVESGKPYLVVFRVTNGYAGDTLSLVATCSTCAPAAGGEPITFEGHRSEPSGPDAPGSYYPVNLTFLSPGGWELQVLAGSDKLATTFVNVRAGSSAG